MHELKLSAARDCVYDTVKGAKWGPTGSILALQNQSLSLSLSLPLTHTHMHRLLPVQLL